MNQSIPLSELGGSAGTSAKWPEIGTSYRGRIVDAREADQTDPDGVIVTFKDGTPRKQWIFSLQQDDGEMIALYAKGGNYVAHEGEGKSMLEAIKAAVVEAKCDALEFGVELVVKFTGRSKPEPPKEGAKLYKAGYRPPAPAAIPVDLFT